MRRTKIISTLGPKSASLDAVQRLVEAGMDVARLNFSHGSHDDHAAACNTVRVAAASAGRTVAVLADLQGPKMRTGPLASGPVELRAGHPFTLTSRPVPGDASAVSMSYEPLASDVRPGDRILLADGALELRVESVSPPDVHCRVVFGGPLGAHKGINLPGVPVSAAALSPKDIEDLAFCLRLGVDYVALSFVRKPEDLVDIRRRIRDAGHDTPVIAKIERPEAVAVLDDLLPLADGIMVARGDLGVEVPLEQIPQVQKDIIRKCNAHGVPVITATQMLESMITNPRPTRAEVTDVANAIHDGTDAVMLSGETAVGHDPVRAVETMAAIAHATDTVRRDSHLPDLDPACAPDPAPAYSDAIARAVRRMTDTLPVHRIVVFTKSGYSARAVARHRPPIPITALTLDEAVQRRCALYWGVDAAGTVEVRRAEDLAPAVDAALVHHGLARTGDIVIIVAGMPIAVGGRTNLLHIHTVGAAAPEHAP